MQINLLNLYKIAIKGKENLRMSKKSCTFAPKIVL